MTSRKGSLLEKDVARMLTLSGLRPEPNKIFRKYELDVFLRVDNKKVGFECKQYEGSKLQLRNVIHQWDSKKKEIGLDRVILVVIGSKVLHTDYELANKLGITIWNEDKFHYLYDTSIELHGGNRTPVLNAMGIKEKITQNDSPSSKLYVSVQSKDYSTESTELLDYNAALEKVKSLPWLTRDKNDRGNSYCPPTVYISNNENYDDESRVMLAISQYQKNDWGVRYHSNDYDSDEIYPHDFAVVKEILEMFYKKQIEEVKRKIYPGK